MPGLLLALRLALAAVFAVAGAAKLADRDGAREALRGFGAPDWAGPAASVALPLAELAIAAALLPSASATLAAACALALLLVFLAAISRALARGEAPDCHCFGQLHSEPAGAGTLARNAALAAAAAVVLVLGRGDAGPSALAWIGHLSAAGAAAVGAGALALALAPAGGWALLAGLRAHGRLLLRVEELERFLRAAGLDDAVEEPLGPAVGEPAPAFALPSMAGPNVGLDGLLERGLPVLLVFTDPGCAPCRRLAPTVARWQREDAAAITIAVVSSGAPSKVRADAARHALDRVLLDRERAVAVAYEADGTPAAVLVDGGGVIAGGPEFGPEGVGRLRDRALAGGLDVVHVEPGLAVGEPAPAVVLPALAGGEVDLSRPRGAPALVLFWNPECGFCAQMRDELRAWERARPAGAPELIVVSTGDAEAARAEGFVATVLLDDDFTAATAFGAGGTPMAVRLGADGRVASPLASGGEAVLALAHSDDGLAVA